MFDENPPARMNNHFLVEDDKIYIDLFSFIHIIYFVFSSQYLTNIYLEDLWQLYEQIV